MRRLTLLALGLLLCLPAVAQASAPGKAVEVALRGLNTGTIVEGTISFEAIASSPAGIERLEILVGGETVAFVEPENVRQNIDLPYSWVTSMVPDSADLAPNGEYDVTARAVANGGADATKKVTVTVDNPAAAPTGVTATAEKRGVLVAWEPNPEPDLLGYQVERSSGGSFEVLTQTIDTTIVDTTARGDVTYRVIAVRSSAARSSGRPSLPSSSVAVDLPGRPEVSSGSADPIGSASLAARNYAFGNAGLPAPAGLPGAPELPGEGDGGPSFRRRLPYEIPKGGIPLSSADDLADPGLDLIPSDGAGWFFAGVFLLALAALARTGAKRLELHEDLPPLRL